MLVTYHQSVFVSLFQCVQNAVQDLQVHPEHQLLWVVSDLSHEASNSIEEWMRADRAPTHSNPSVTTRKNKKTTAIT